MLNTTALSKSRQNELVTILQSFYKSTLSDDRVKPAECPQPPLKISMDRNKLEATKLG